MCLAVYLASSHPLRSIAWDGKAPAFYLEPISATDPVRRQFSVAHVYYAGSHQGCGCGFSKAGETGPEFERCQANYIALGKSVRQALASGSRVELFACWEGDQTDEPEANGTVTPSELEEPSFSVRELQFLRVIADDA